MGKERRKINSNLSFSIKMVKKLKKNISLDDLALMVAKGFEETAKKVDLESLEKEINLQFGEVNERLDRIEKILFRDYKNRIEKLENQVKELQSDFRQLVGFRK